jgi:endonuclease G
MINNNANEQISRLWVKRLLITLIAPLLLYSCSRDAKVQQPVQVASAPAVEIQTATIPQPLAENFETGTKGTYTTGTVSLSSGNWIFDDALIGSSPADAKNGAKAARIRNSGKLSMGFDVATGASIVTIRHAAYGKDGNSQWQLWISADGGATYTLVDTTLTTAGNTLTTTTFNINKAGSLRLEIRKISGGTNRINIDNFIITPYGAAPADSATIAVADNSNLLLGNPSNAIDNMALADNYLMDKGYYIESYNATRGAPNWVSWYLGSTSLGKAPRHDDFRADKSLPASFYVVQNTSYAGTGFDRGHNCPSADRTSTATANDATFLMTNMMPQAPNNNEHTWAALESYERTLVTQGNELYVVAGSYGTGGTGAKGFANSIDNGHIIVPAHTWKVIVVLPNGDHDLSRITTATRVIAVDMPNANNISLNWQNYITTVDAIEAATGYNIMTNIPVALQTVLEARADATNW